VHHKILKRLWAKIIPRQKLRKAVFLHIQKTAGTSIVEAAAKHYGGSWISHLDYSGKSPDDVRRTFFISGHFGYAYALQWMPDRYSFTFLRNPEDRIISFYYYCRGCSRSEYQINELAHSLSLNEFLDCGLHDWRIKPYIWNHQTWQLALGWGNLQSKRLYEFSEDELIARALTNIMNFDHIGLTESFDADYREISKALGFPYSRKSHKANTASRPAFESLPDFTIQKLERLTRLDRVLYEYVLGRRGASS